MTGPSVALAATVRTDRVEVALLDGHAFGEVPWLIDGSIHRVGCAVRDQLELYVCKHGNEIRMSRRNWQELIESGESGHSGRPDRSINAIDGLRRVRNAGSDARFLVGDAGIPTVHFGSGTIEDDAHTVGEPVAVDGLVDTARIYRGVLDRFLSVG